MRLWRAVSMQAAVGLACALFSSLAAAAQAANVRARITQAVDGQNLIALRGNTHPLARPQYDVGAAADDQPIERMLLVLQRGAEQEAALRKLLDEQQIKSSPHYHQWLTPQQFGQQFGPADSDIQVVTDWLTSQGFQVNHVATGRTVIEFSGTAGLVREALHTEIHRYTINGEAHWANASDPQIPAALAPVVAGIASLNNFPRKPLHHPLGTFTRSKATGEVRPLFTFPGNTGNYYAVGPADFATIYNVQPLWDAGTDGTGQTIAIVAQSNINLEDVAAFRSMFGLPANAPNVVLNGPDPGVVAGDEGEAVLDVEWAGAVAKNATIDLVVSESTETDDGIDLSALYVVDNNLAPVMSESYGACEAALGTGGNAFYNALWEQAAAQGITVVIASGDSGAAGCDNLPAEIAAQYGLGITGFASTPFNVAVGGTDFDDLSTASQYWNMTNTSSTQNSAKSYIPEATWNDSCANTGSTTGCASGVASDGTDLIAAGGGPSNCATSTGSGFCTGAYAKPSWQAGTGVPSDSVRDIPDVSVFASDGYHGSFYVICQMDANAATGGNTSSCDLNAPYQNFQGAGGTSVSAQAFAGIMALVNQKTGQRQGNANYVLYKLAAQNGASCNSSSLPANTSGCIFYDVTKGNISVACQGGSPNCSKSTAGGYGVLVDPNSTSSPAWTTSTGYDLATGLGTVNAANLVNHWNSVSFAPTTTTLSITPTTITHGQSVNVTIQVTSTSGTPTGDVSLIGGPNHRALGIDFATLSNGTVSGATNLLPGGTYGVTAHYAGDGTFAASDSTPPIQVTVTKENSVTQLGLVTFDLNGNVTSFNATTAPYGSPYVLRVDVTNSSSQPCSSNAVPCPTGQVTLTDNGQVLDLGTYTLNSLGYLEDQPIQFPAGAHNVVANYAGDNSYNASQSAPDAISVTRAATSTSVSFSESGGNFTLTALVSTQSNGGAPAGTVQFFNGGNPIGGAANCSGTAYSPATGAFATCQATLTTTFTAAATVTAQYSGDSNYAQSPVSAPVTVPVTADFTLSANPTSLTIAAPGQSQTSTITETAINGFTGTVNFTCSVPAAMTETTCSLSPSSLANSGSTTLTIQTTGSHTVMSLYRNRRWSPGAGGIVLALILLLGLLFLARRQWKLVPALLFLALVAVGSLSCGGGGGGGSPINPGTPAGTYTVTVTATSGSISHTVNVSVTVQ